MDRYSGETDQIYSFLGIIQVALIMSLHLLLILPIKMYGEYHHRAYLLYVEYKYQLLPLSHQDRMNRDCTNR